MSAGPAAAAPLSAGAGRGGLARAIGILPGEGPAFLWASATAFLVGWSDVSLANVADTFFLKRVGVQYLPLVFLANSLLLVGSTLLMSRLAAGRASAGRVAGVFFGLALMLLPLWVLVLEDVRSVFVLLVLAAKQTVSIAAVVFWATVGGLFNGRQAKRLFAPIISGGTLGGIVGSFASAALGKLLGIPQLLLVAAFALTLAGVLAFRIRALAPPRLAAPGARAARPALLALVSPLWRESRLFRLLTVTTILCGALGPMLYFQFSYVADLATQGGNGEQRLLRLYATLRGFINLGVLAIQLAGTSRLFRRLGVPLSAALSPLVYLLGFLGVSVRLELPAAIGAMAGASLQDHALYEPAEKVLTTLFPERLRAVGAAWIEGPVRRVGSALGNLVVIAVLALGTPASVGWIGLPLAAVWFAVQIALWRAYPSLLLEASAARRGVEREPLSFEELVDPSTLRVLEATLASQDLARVRAACDLVLEAPASRAAGALARAARRAPAATRPTLLEALDRLTAGVDDGPRPSADTAHELEALLGDPAAALTTEETARAVRALGRLAPSLAPGTAAGGLVAALAQHRELAVRVAAQARLAMAAPSDGAAASSAASAAPGIDLDALVDEGLASEDPAARQIALAELRSALLAEPPGSVHFARRAARVGLLLATAATRADAAEALADAACRHGDAAADAGAALLARAHDADPRVRAAVLRFVGAAGLASHAALAAERLGARDPLEAAAAAAALRKLGPSAVAAVVGTLMDGGLRARDAAAEILTDLPGDAAALRAAVERQVEAARASLGVRRALARGFVHPVHPLALQRLAERAAESLHGALLVLAVLTKEERVGDLARLLVRTQGGRARAVLLEALDALLPPADARRVLPLLEDVTTAPPVNARSDALGRPLLPQGEAEAAARESGDLLLRELLLAGAADLENAPAAANPVQERVMPTRLETIFHLRGLDLFSRLTTRQLGEVAGAFRAERHAARAVLIREGEFGDCMYLVVSGEVEVSREGHVVAREGPGNIIGELALFDGETRSATITTSTPVELLRLERADLFALLEEEPGIAIGICQTLSRKMRELIRETETRKRNRGEGP